VLWWGGSRPPPEHTTSSPNSLTWQQSAWNCYLANDIYIVYILTHVNSQTNDKTVIAFGDYQQVASSKLIPFDQANTQYFQPMLKSFQLKQRSRHRSSSCQRY
jgi:hypothetical protein